MPAINITGKKSDGIPYSRTDRADADYQNRDYDLRTQFHQRMDRQKEAALERGDKDLRREAQEDNREFDLRLRYERRLEGQRRAELAQGDREMRQEAQWFNQDHDAKKRFAIKQQQLQAKAFVQQRKDFEDAHQAAHDHIGQQFQSHFGGTFGRALGYAVPRAISRASGEESALENLATASRFITVAGVIFEGLKTAATLPFTIANKVDQIVGAATPYMNLRMSTANIGRAGGFDATDMRLDFLPEGTGRGTAAWMNGYTPQSATDTLGAYGASFDGKIPAESMLSLSMAASRSQYLGGMDPSTYMGLMGTQRMLNMKETSDGWFSSDPNNATMGEHSNMLRNMQQVMQAATMYGLDHSKVLGTVAGLWTQAASDGAASVSYTKSSDFWNRMAGSGDPNMRTGQGILNAARGMDQATMSMGLGGGTVQTMAFSQYVQGHGGLPKTQAALEKQLGVNYDDLGPAQQRQFNNALQAAQSGSGYWYAEAAKPFVAGNRSLQENIASNYASAFGLPNYMTDPIEGAAGAMGSAGASALNATRGTKLPNGGGAGFAWADIPDPRISKAIDDASARTGLSKNLLAGLFSYETGGFRNFTNKSGGGFGALGLGQVRKPALDQLHSMGEDLDINQNNLLDPEMGARASADYLAYLVKIKGGVHEGLKSYYGSSSDFHNESYAEKVEQRESGFGNDTTDVGGVITTQGQTDGLASRQAYTAAEQLNGSLAQGILTFDRALVGGAKGVDNFVTALAKAISMLQGVAPPGHTFVVPGATHRTYGLNHL